MSARIVHVCSHSFMLMTSDKNKISYNDSSCWKYDRSNLLTVIHHCVHHWMITIHRRSVKFRWSPTSVGLILRRPRMSAPTLMIKYRFFLNTFYYFLVAHTVVWILLAPFSRVDRMKYLPMVVAFKGHQWRLIHWSSDACYWIIITLSLFHLTMSLYVSFSCPVERCLGLGTSFSLSFSSGT